MDRPVQLIAVHGVGRHKPGEIEDQVRDTVGRRGDFNVSVAEFNWDQYAHHGRIDSWEEGVENLRRVSASLHGMAVAALEVRQGGLDARLCAVQVFCCIVLRWVMAALVATIFAIPAIVIVVLLPTALMQIAPLWPTRELHWLWAVLPPIVACLVAGPLAVILVLGCARAAISRSFGPVRSATTCAVLTCAAPFIALISTPLSVSWVAVGGFVLFFGAFGVFISIVTWLLPDEPAYTAWRGFTIGRYLLGIIVGLLCLQGLSHLLLRAWHEGPIKILLDIARYVGEPSYRRDTLERLDEFIHQGKEDGPGLVIVAHSLGTVIALDYLGNWRSHDSGRDVTLVTMGSPYRRYFLTWLPDVLFDKSLENTVGRIAARYHSFRWVNVYRPWDYIGTSLGLARSGLGTDQSTRQRLRLNGHSGYWADDTVLATVATALKSAPTTVSPCVLPASGYIPAHPARRSRTPHYIVLPTALALVSLAWMAYSFVSQQSDLARMRAAIDERGNITQVFVSHREIPDVSDDLATADEFKFAGNGIELPSYQLAPTLPFSIAQQRFDHRRLVNFVRRDCRLEGRPGFLGSDKMIYCKSKTPIEIAYLSPLTKEDFYLPDFRPRFYYSDIASWTLYPLITVLFCSLFAWPFVALTSALHSAFVGLDPQEALDMIS